MIHFSLNYSEVALQHLVKCFVRNRLFNKVGEAVLDLKVRDSHSFETRGIRDEALILVLEEVVLT